MPHNVPDNAPTTFQNEYNIFKVLSLFDHIAPSSNIRIFVDTTEILLSVQNCLHFNHSLTGFFNQMQNKLLQEIPSGDSYHALSNMPNKTADVNETSGTTTVHFEESVRMSTYLACFIVSDFTSKSFQINDDLQMRVFATPAQINKTDFALATGANITDFYIKYFNVSYPLPKLGNI